MANVVRSEIQRALAPMKQHQRTQDLPLEKRAQQVFLMGLRWQLGEWGFVKREIELSANYAWSKIGPKLVVKLAITNGRLHCDWEDGGFF